MPLFNQQPTRCTSGWEGGAGAGAGNFPAPGCPGEQGARIPRARPALARPAGLRGCPSPSSQQQPRPRAQPPRPGSPQPGPGRCLPCGGDGADSAGRGRARPAGFAAPLLSALEWQMGARSPLQQHQLKKPTPVCGCSCSGSLRVALESRE